MKVCYWGTFEKQYPRNAVLISGLRQNGIEVVECHFALWKEGFRYTTLTRLCHFVDWSACRLATLVLVDTKAQRNFFCQEFGLAKEKVRWLYMGADEAVFAPYPEPPCPPPFRVLYVGNYVPLHGVPIILQAARLLD